MTGWTISLLTIQVPTVQRDRLLGTLQGPEHWLWPKCRPTPGDKPLVMNAHQRIAIHAILNATTPDHQTERTRLIAEFLATRRHPRPSWMPLARYELQLFWKSHQEHPNGQPSPEPYEPDTVGFSVPKLLPWADRADFDTYFPGVVDPQGFWAHPEYNHHAWHASIHLQSQAPALMRTRPSHVTMGPHTTCPEGTTHILFTFRTPPRHPQQLARPLRAALSEHHAQALLVWTEETGESGCVFLRPNTPFQHHLFPAGLWRGLAKDPSTWDTTNLVAAIQRATSCPFAPRFT